MIIPDSRFENPSLFYPGRKPVGNVKIDWSNPLAKGLIFSTVGQSDLVSGFVFDKQGSLMNRGDIEHDNTSDITVLEQGIDSIIPTSEISIALGYKKTDGTNRSSAGAFGFGDTSHSTVCGTNLPYSTGTVYFDFGGLGPGSTSKSGLTFGDDNWVFSSSLKNNVMYIVQNGINTGASTGTAVTRTRSSTNSFTLGSHLSDGSDLAIYKYMHIYDRQLSIEECRLLNENPYRFIIPA